MTLVPSSSHGGSAPTTAQVAAAGAPIIRKFPFAFNTPGILTGAALYTPTIGDVLLDAWIEIVTAWDGTTPKGDLGSFVAQTYGEFGGNNAPIDMRNIDAVGNNDPTWLAQGLGSNPSEPSGLYQAYLGATPPPFQGVRAVPIKFTTADPVRFCVSSTGATNGAAPGSTQGAAILYLITATPA